MTVYTDTELYSKKSIAALTLSSSGDNTAIAAPGAGYHLEVHRLVLTSARGYNVDVILKNGSTAVTGAMVADIWDLDFGVSPLVISTNSALVVNLSAAVAVTGFVQYMVVED